jgi:methyltransferase (TIGR00027 family)
MNNSMDEVAADGCVVIRAGKLALKMGIEDPYAKMFVTEAGRNFFEMAKKVDPYYEPHNLSRFKFTSSLIKNLPADIEQAVILGAGFDCRPFYLKTLADERIRVFEVDTALQMRIKSKVLADSCVSVPENIRFIPYNLNNTGIFEELAKNGYDPELKTLLFMEGVLFTLPEKITQMLIDPETLNLQKGSRVIFDYWKASRIKKLNALLMQSIGKTFFFEPDFVEDDKLFADHLKSLGYGDVTITKIDDLADEYLPKKFKSSIDSGWRIVRAVA